jgi:hypothetical protein
MLPLMGDRSLAHSLTRWLALLFRSFDRTRHKRMGQWADAVRYYTAVCPMYRRERWWSILRVALQQLLTCLRRSTPDTAAAQRLLQQTHMATLVRMHVARVPSPPE